MLDFMVRALPKMALASSPTVVAIAAVTTSSVSTAVVEGVAELLAAESNCGRDERASLATKARGARSATLTRRRREGMSPEEA